MSSRVRADGKHLRLDGQPFRVRGVTYGTFAARRDGARYPEPNQVCADFGSMRDVGLNVVRTYTIPPPDVVELAAEHELRLLVGLDYLDWRMEPRPGRSARRRIADAGRRAVAEAMELCSGRPEILAVSVGNEIPGDLVRLYGIPSVEEALSTLVADVHSADPEMLACYINFPTTEYLKVEDEDLACFNVFLEEPGQLRRYLRHLQIVSGDRPLVITELGLAAGVHGEDAQAGSLEWQLRIVDETGSAGASIFAWTDEWVVGDARVQGWEFGLTHTDRRPKPARGVAGRWARSSIRDLRETWPRISAIVCAYNAAGTIGECLESLLASDYPELEIVVCDDGSDDGTAEIAEGFPVRVLRLRHGGLAHARNAGIAAAAGEIVAFLDSDAACHPEWPYHLALSLEDEGVVGTGGPNLPFRQARFGERVVAAAPGGPMHVCLSDDRAEHVPGCNMAFERNAVDQVGRFDPIYRVAGDDVDLCWKLLDEGHEIAFSAAAQVRHHRRSSVRGYLAQQRGYGRSERLVSSRHGHRFNGLGQARWAGFIYGGPGIFGRFFRPVIYHGSMGSAPYQRVVGRRAEHALAWSSALLPYVVPFALLGALAPTSLWWLLAPVAVALVLLTHFGAVAAAVRPPRREQHPLAFRILVGLLHTLQPLVRAWGRLVAPRAQPLPRAAPTWLGDRAAWLADLRAELMDHWCRVRSGGSYAGWDLEASLGLLVRCRVTTAVSWRWTPSYRLVVLPRFAAFVAVAVGVATTLLVSSWDAFVLLGTAVAVAVEASLLLLVVRRSLRVTTQGAAGSRELAADLQARVREHAEGDLAPPPAGVGSRRAAETAAGRAYEGVR